MEYLPATAEDEKDGLVVALRTYARPSACTPRGWSNWPVGRARVSNW